MQNQCQHSSVFRTYAPISKEQVNFGDIFFKRIREFDFDWNLTDGGKSQNLTTPRVDGVPAATATPPCATNGQSNEFVGMALRTLGFCSCCFDAKNVEKKWRFSSNDPRKVSFGHEVSVITKIIDRNAFFAANFDTRFRLTCKKYLGANQNGGNRVLHFCRFFFLRIKANRRTFLTSNYNVNEIIRDFQFLFARITLDLEFFRGHGQGRPIGANPTHSIASCEVFQPRGVAQVNYEWISVASGGAKFGLFGECCGQGCPHHAYTLAGTGAHHQAPSGNTSLSSHSCPFEWRAKCRYKHGGHHSKYSHCLFRLLMFFVNVTLKHHSNFLKDMGSEMFC